MGMPVTQPSTITRKKSMAYIVSSFAAEESASVYILNVESKKLQTVIDMSGTIVSKLMALNRSVKVVVDTAVQL